MTARRTYVAAASIVGAVLDVCDPAERALEEGVYPADTESPMISTFGSDLFKGAGGRPHGDADTFALRSETATPNPTSSAVGCAALRGGSKGTIFLVGTRR